MEQMLFDSNSEFSTVNEKKLNELIILVEQLVTNKVRIEKIKNDTDNGGHAKILDDELRIVDQIQDSIKKVRLISLKTITGALEELLSSLNHEHSSKVELVFQGGETEVENSLIGHIEKILICLIKNIFEKELKLTENKLGLIKIAASSDERNFTVTIESNGLGFDYENICKVLNKKNLELLDFTEEDTREFFELINITNDIEELVNIKTDLAYFDGNIKFEAKPNEYRRVSITVPLFSSIMQGLLVKTADQFYAVPLEYIQTVIKKEAVDIKNSNNAEMIIYMNKVIRLIRLSEILNVQAKEDADARILIVSANNEIAALMVDSLQDQTDMVIKPRHRIVNDVKVFKGTTILGDGLVTLVIDVPAILKQF